MVGQGDVTCGMCAYKSSCTSSAQQSGRAKCSVKHSGSSAVVKTRKYVIQYQERGSVVKGPG